MLVLHVPRRNLSTKWQIHLSSFLQNTAYKHIFAPFCTTDSRGIKKTFTYGGKNIQQPLATLIQHYFYSISFSFFKCKPACCALQWMHSCSEDQHNAALFTPRCRRPLYGQYASLQSTDRDCKSGNHTSEQSAVRWAPVSSSLSQLVPLCIRSTRKKVSRRRPDEAAVETLQAGRG